MAFALIRAGAQKNMTQWDCWIRPRVSCRVARNDVGLNTSRGFGNSTLRWNPWRPWRRRHSCGRRFTRAQLARVQETVHTCPHLSRNELALTLCEHLDWTTPKGTYKVRSCLKLVEALEARGIICLPATRQKRASVHAAIPFQGPDAPIDTSLDALAPISLHPVTTAEDRALWRSYVESHHYLGYKRPIGAHLFYFVAAEARQQKLGCVSFSAAAAWALAPRDTWIGWDNQHREQLLQLVLYQNRFLIFPWVNVANLGSKILSLEPLAEPTRRACFRVARRQTARSGFSRCDGSEGSRGLRWSARDVPPHGAFLPGESGHARGRTASASLGGSVPTVRWFAIHSR